ncbi:MAG: 4-hydroxy-tetrahydrodipicolinate synthase [Gammaproteobacteria bacterium]|nr:4-hydroxy-tetrahydrodipicolinate synthase [Gammaproteobacteria bacterium]
MFQGSMVAMITPMAPDGAVDESALEQLVDFHLQEGTDAIVAMGTTGESATLSFDEHIAVVRSVVKYVAGKIPVIAGTGANSTQEAIELTQAAKNVGADACLLVTPYYNKPTQEGLYLHHKAIAEAVSIPQFLYNVPGRTACDMGVETTRRLSEIANIIGIKDATGDLGRAREILDQTDDDFILLSGDDATAMEQILLGGKGGISVTANVAPAKMHTMYALALAGDADQAGLLNDELMGLHQNLFLEANPIPVKWAVSAMGMCQQGIRLPMTWLSEQYHAQVLDAMTRAGINVK